MALFFEKTCRSRGLAVRIIPVPRQISSSCGLACSYPCTDEETIKTIVSEKEIEISGYYKV